MKRLTALIFMLVPATALASETPRPGLLDPRIKTVPYEADQVVQLRGVLGVATTLEFAEDERIENVSIGDALGWQVTPNKRANLLFLKPLDRTASTNMTVITDRRRYNFELTVATLKAARDEIAYAVRFTYPAPPVTAAPPSPAVAPAEPQQKPDAFNFAYAYDGDRGVLPSRVFDDGTATFFQWPQTIALPTVFAVGPDGRERLLNMNARGRYFVVDEVAPKFRIREGKQTLTIVNQAWSAPGRGPDAPKPLKGNALKDLLAREHRW